MMCAVMRERDGVREEALVGDRTARCRALKRQKSLTHLVVEHRDPGAVVWP